MPSYQYAIVGAQPADNLEPIVDVFPKWRELVARLWPELGQMTLRMAPEGAAHGEIPITVTDDVSDAQALALHTRNIFGAVSCVVERPQCKKYNLPLGPALLHEVAESGINPELNRNVTVPLILTPGAARVMTTIPLEIVDPITFSTVAVGGVLCCNVSGPRFWLLANDGAFDLIGAATAPLPQIPKCGAIDTASGQLIYGDEVTPELLQYLKERRGRRFAMRKILAGLGHLLGEAA